MKKCLSILMVLILTIPFAACNASPPAESVLDISQEAAEALRAERDALKQELERIQAELEAVEAGTDDEQEGDTSPNHESSDEYGEAGVEPQESESRNSPAEAPASQELQPQQEQVPAPTQQVQSQAQSVVAQGDTSPSGNSANGTGVFEGAVINVYDHTTPAVRAAFFDRTFTTAYFLSIDERRLGSIAGSDYLRIMEQHSLNDGNDLWFADEFNKFRGLGSGSRFVGSIREEVVAAESERMRWELVRLINQERERHGLHSLDATEEAMHFAQTRAIEASSSFSHVRPDGSRPGDWGYNENLSYGATPDGVLRGWLNSSGHRGNILVERLSTIGVGVYNSGGVITWVFVAGG